MLKCSMLTGNVVSMSMSMRQYDHEVQVCKNRLEFGQKSNNNKKKKKIDQAFANLKN